MRRSLSTGVRTSCASSRINTSRLSVEAKCSAQRLRSALKPAQRLWIASGEVVKRAKGHVGEQHSPFAVAPHAVDDGEDE